MASFMTNARQAQIVYLGSVLNVPSSRHNKGQDPDRRFQHRIPDSQGWKLTLRAPCCVLGLLTSALSAQDGNEEAEKQIT